MFGYLNEINATPITPYYAVAGACCVSGGDGMYLYRNGEDNCLQCNRSKVFTLLVKVGVVAGKNSTKDTLILSFVIGKCTKLKHSVFKRLAGFRKDSGDQGSVGGSTGDVV
jgi:hypothetical protein